MRQTLKERRTQLNRGMPMPRLFTMALMLAIMALIFVQVRNPRTWRFFARDSDDDEQIVDQAVVSQGAVNQAAVETAKPAASAKTIDSGKADGTRSGPATSADGTRSVPATSADGPAGPLAAKTPPPKDSASADPELTPTGPTDLDPIEQEDIKQAISIISDGNLEMSTLDMPAYFQILSWVDHQSTKLLRQRAKRDVLYSDFRKTPESMRLQIVELKLNVRQIIRLTMPPKNGITEPMTTRDGQPIYEVRGFTQEGGSNLYFGIVTDLPKGMPVGTSINEDARLVGYFFKLQGYISLQQQLEAERTRKRPAILKAPVILGRLIWIVPPPVAEEKSPVWLLATLGTAGVVVVVGSVLLASRKLRRSRPLAVVRGLDPDPDAPSVDNWLDQAQSGRLSLEPVPESTARYDGASLSAGAMENSFGDRFSGNIFGGNGESNNGRGGLGPEVRENDSPSGG